MKRTLCCLTLLMMTMACAQSSPTAPTAPQPPTQPGPAVLQLNWNVTAPSCAPVTLPPSQPAFADATIVKQSDTNVTAAWPYQSQTLYANFVFENNAWALCSWDVADV